MSIWNKVLAGLILVTSVAFFYFALRALRTHQHWRELAQKQQAALEKTLEEQRSLIWGGEGRPGIRQVEAQVYRLNLCRGRAWQNAQPQKVDAATGEVTVVTPFGPAHERPQGTQLSVFLQASGQNPAVYLGDFQITAVSDKIWQLRPTRALSPRELGRLQQASRGGLWVLYERIPSMTPELLAEMTGAAAPEAEKPAAGPEAEKPPVSPPKGDSAPPKPSSPVLATLIDYRQVFDYYYMERSRLTDLIESAKNDLKGLTEAQNAADAEIKLLEAELAKHKALLAEASRQRDAVAGHLQAVEAKRAEFESRVAQTIQENQTTAQKLAQAQLEAARRIEERTRRTASIVGP